MKLSARNKLKGKILDVKKGATTAHVRLEIAPGQIVTASITNEAVEELGLKPVGAAIAVIKASDVVADTAFRAMNTFRQTYYPSNIRQPILMLAASSDEVVSTAAIEEFAYHLRAGSHLVIAGSKHEILQEQDRYRQQFWAAFDAFVPGTPLFG